MFTRTPPMQSTYTTAGGSTVTWTPWVTEFRPPGRPEIGAWTCSGCLRGSSGSSRDATRAEARRHADECGRS